MTISYTNCVSNNFHKSFNFFLGPKVYWPINYLPDTAPIPVLERNYNNSPLGLMQSRKDCEIFVRNSTRRGIWLKNRGDEPKSVKKQIKQMRKDNPNFSSGREVRISQAIHQAFYVRLQTSLDYFEGPFLWRNRFDSIEEEIDYLNNHWKKSNFYWEQKKAEKK
tara:strand:- start:243 stop:734 length:492 start_codon:yes stop_codon:yes gene_type:complete